MLKIKIPSLPVQLILVIILTLFLGKYLPLDVKSAFLAISLSIKTLLLFILPWLVLSFIFGSLANLPSGGLGLVLLTFPLICFSNTITTFVAYAVGNTTLGTGKILQNKIIATENILNPAWYLDLAPIISNQKALLLGLGLGLFFGIFFKKTASYMGTKLTNTAMLILKYGFIPFLPIFIFGFLLKLQFEGLLLLIFKEYLAVVLIIIMTLFTYIVFLYGLSKKFNLGAWFTSLKNVFGAIFVGLTTMSSAAALPVSIIAAEKNTGDPKLARFFMPATVNIHLIGDCIAIPILAMAILISYGKPIPDIGLYTKFVTYFVLAKFAVAAVPAGGIIVMLPVLEQYLGFNYEMLSLITGLYIMLDFIITSMNIAGNGGFVMLFQKFYMALNNVCKIRV